jgi:hypothetical protein
VKKGVWIVYGWRDEDGFNVIAGRVKRIEGLHGDKYGYHRYFISFYKRGFMANPVLRAVLSEEHLLDGWGLEYHINGRPSDNMFILIVCEDEKDMQNAYFAAVL